MVELALVSLHGRLDPGFHAVVDGLPHKLECQDAYRKEIALLRRG